MDMSKYRAIKKRKIILGGTERLYTVTEFPEFIRVRVYGSSKNSYADARFTWETAWGINQYKPSLAALIYDYAVRNGWNPEANKPVSFTGEDILPDGWSNTEPDGSPEASRP